MNLKQAVRKMLQFVFAQRPIHVTTQIATLAPNELLKDRFALITGGTSGIGYAIAEAFLKAGASVCITGRSEQKLSRSCQQLIALNANYKGRVYSIVLDNQNIPSFSSKINLVSQMRGKIDILVNNAGVLGGHISNSTEEEYDTVLNTNLKGVFFLSQEVGKHMKEKQIRGNIINIASSSSLRPAASAYTISKWGIRGLTLGLAKSMAPLGITVNGIAPGPTATPMLMKGDRSNIAHCNIPAGRYAMPEEIANMTVFLVSNMGRMVVGDIVYMTGGAGILTYDDMEYSF